MRFQLDLVCPFITTAFFACHVGPPHPPPPSGEVRLTTALREAAGTSVRVHRRGEERVYGLPEDALAYDATIATSSPDRTCFDVTLRMLEGQATHAPLDKWRPTLEIGGQTWPTASVLAGETKRSSASAAPLAARRGPDVVDCAEVNSAGNCARHDVYETKVVGREQGEMALVESTGRACFAGSVPPAGDLVLRLARPAAIEAPDAATFRFRR
jgi:hypothetical protein